MMSMAQPTSKYRNISLFPANVGADLEVPGQCAAFAASFTLANADPSLVLPRGGLRLLTAWIMAFNASGICRAACLARPSSESAVGHLGASVSASKNWSLNAVRKGLRVRAAPAFFFLPVM